MTKFITGIRYDGPSRDNVRPARLGELSVAAMEAAILALPPRKPIGGNVVALDAVRERRS